MPVTCVILSEMRCKGFRLELPGRTFADLDVTLTHYFRKARANEAERADLLEIARAVLREPVGASP